MTGILVTLGGFVLIVVALLHFDVWYLLLFLGVLLFLAGLTWRSPDKRKPG
jgi:hypothetical protein